MCVLVVCVWNLFGCGRVNIQALDPHSPLTEESPYSQPAGNVCVCGLNVIDPIIGELTNDGGVCWLYLPAMQWWTLLTVAWLRMTRTVILLNDYPYAAACWFNVCPSDLILLYYYSNMTVCYTHGEHLYSQVVLFWDIILCVVVILETIIHVWF